MGDPPCEAHELPLDLAEGEAAEDALADLELAPLRVGVPEEDWEAVFDTVVEGGVCWCDGGCQEIGTETRMGSLTWTWWWCRSSQGLLDTMEEVLPGPPTPPTNHPGEPVCVPEASRLAL